MKLSESNRRLRVLAAFLDKLPHKRFNYSSWVGRDWRGKPDLSCGTTACALGWATTIPEFRRRSLRLGAHRLPTLDSVSYAGPFDAGAIIFGISLNASRALFGGEMLYLTRRMRLRSADMDETAKEVARRIRKFIKYRGEKHNFQPMKP